jgi:ABC-type transport system substrate-binding protein
MVVQFESGALDVISTPPMRDFVRFRDDGGYQALVHGSSGSYYMSGWNTLQEPFTDKRVRQALNWAIDRQAFTDTILLETVEPFSLPWPKSSLAYNEEQSNHYQFDLDKARALLDEAGVDDLSYGCLLAPDIPEEIEFAQIYQADLAEIGISMEVNTVEKAAWLESINADPPSFDGYWMGGSARSNLGAPITHFVLSVTWEHTKGDNNTAYYSDQYRDLINQLQVVFDEEEQKRLYTELNALMLEDSWVAILAPRPPRIAAQENVMNVFAMPAREGFETGVAWLA